MTFQPDTFAPGALNLSFEQVLTDDAKANPLRLGLHVSVYNDADHGLFITYGVITRKHWCSFGRAYLYDVQVAQSDAVIRAWSYQLRAMTPEECRMSFLTVRNWFDQ